MNKKKILISLVFCLLVISIGVMAVSAQTIVDVLRDTTCYPSFGGQCGDAFGLEPAASASPAGGCTATQNAYVAWNLAGIQDPITSAQLTFTVSNVTGQTAAPLVFEMYEPAGPWTVDGNDPGPQTGNVKATKSQVITGAGEMVTFDGAGVAAYFESKRGGEASVGVRIADGCSASTKVTFYDSDQTQGQQDGPQLDIGD